MDDFTTVLSGGYLCGDYAHALELGKARFFPNAQGWWIERRIPDCEWVDGMGVYPMLCCQDWTNLAGDLADIERQVVSFAAVVDPLGDYDEAMLRTCFPDVLFPYKQHYTVDLTQPLENSASKHHRYYSRRALRSLTVKLSASPVDFADIWIGLYSTLAERHRMGGFAAFSSQSLRSQLEVQGMQVFHADDSDGETVGMSLWAMHGDKAYYHLSASNPGGYRLGASYALVWSALHHFQQTGVKIVNLGAGAGIAIGSVGLSDFKAGWATGIRTAWFGGRILDAKRYAQLSENSATGIQYFPLYRAKEAGVDDANGQ
jgi:hypothetical protein